MSRLVHFIFPVTCCGCGADLPAGDIYRVCGSCLQKIKFIEGLICKKCGIPLPDGGAHCWRCRKNTRRHFEFIRSSVEYTGLAKELLLKFKFHGRYFLNRFLGRLLILELEKYPGLAGVDFIIPVPLHWAKKLLRGYNQSELLAKTAAGYMGKPVEERWLKRVKFTKPQFSLKRDERIKNLSNCFKVKRGAGVKGSTILIIDDICTTSTTIEQCAAALKKKGAKKVYALTVARDV
ncbi:MAG: ComF family protein [Elusimicrobiota bacterium]